MTRTPGASSRIIIHITLLRRYFITYRNCIVIVIGHSDNIAIININIVIIIWVLVDEI